MRRIYQFDEIKPMVSAAPAFFPKTQEELDQCFVYLIDGFCYAGIKKLKHHPDIGEVQIISDKSQKRFLSPALFRILLSLVHSFGFSRMAMRFQNERLKQICLKKGWIVPWGLGFYVNRDNAVFSGHKDGV
jgi:hypothetical protein